MIQSDQRGPEEQVDQPRAESDAGSDPLPAAHPEVGRPGGPDAIETATGGPARPESERTSVGNVALHAVRHELSRVWPALAVFVGLHVLGLVLLALISYKVGGADVPRLLGTRFDSYWYARIAVEGYDAYAPKSYAMFPLYPTVIAALAPLTPGPTWTTALLISWTGALAAAWGIFRLGTHLRDERTGLILVALWSILPHAVIQLSAYTESIFTAFAAWALYAVLTRRWVTAGVLTLLAGLTRPSASALVLAVGLAALVAVVKRQDGWRPWVGGALAPLGFVGYIAWVGLQLDRPDGYFWVQSEFWGSKFDGGVYTVGAFVKYMTLRGDLGFYVCGFVLVAALVLGVLLMSERWPWPLVVYGVALFATVLGTAGYFHSKSRLLLPAFTLLLPVAAGMTKVRARNAALIFGSLGLATAWYGAYLLLMWKLSP